MIIDLGNGRQAVVLGDRLTLWANKGCLGVELTEEQRKKLSKALWYGGKTP